MAESKRMEHTSTSGLSRPLADPPAPREGTDSADRPPLGDVKRGLAMIYAKAFLREHPGWHRTQDIAAGIGLEHEAGVNDDIRYLRDALYALNVAGNVELQQRQNGHLWRIPRAADARREMVEVSAASSSWPSPARRYSGEMAAYTATGEAHDG